MRFEMIIAWFLSRFALNLNVMLYICKMKIESEVSTLVLWHVLKKLIDISSRSSIWNNGIKHVELFIEFFLLFLFVNRTTEMPANVVEILNRKVRDFDLIKIYLFSRKKFFFHVWSRVLKKSKKLLFIFCCDFLR